MTAFKSKGNDPQEPFAGSVGRLECLDSIRGLAALAVLFCHVRDFTFCWPIEWVHWTRYPMLRLPFEGRGAVAMFFVLSGFVLARPYISGGAKFNLPAFYIRRFIRIYFPWFCAFVLTLICRCFLYFDFGTQPPQNKFAWQDPVALKDILLQSVFFHYWLGGHLLPQGWSLGIELIGSALIPLFVAIAVRPRHLFWFLGLGIASVALVPQNANNPGGGGFYASFILGVLLVRHQDALVNWLRRLGPGRRVLFLLSGLFAYQSQRIADHFGFNDLGTAGIVWVFMSVGSAAIVLATLSSRRITHYLTLKPVLWIGKASYSIYLLQMITLCCVLPAAIAVLNKLGFKASFWMFPFCLVIAFAVTAAMAAPFYEFVERPSIELGHQISARLKKRVSSKPVPLQPTARS